MKCFMIILSLFVMYSCGDIKKKEKALSVVEQWVGKEIIYPENLNFTILGIDTLRNEIQRQSLYKVVSYVDSTGCTSCKLQLPRWKAFVAEMDSVSGGKSVMYLILHSKKVLDIVYTLKYNSYKYPVCIDENNSFYEVNHLPSNESFQTFLLDKNNKIIAVGNPIHNLKIKKLYLEIIGGEKLQKKEIAETLKTKVDIEKKVFTFGTFDWRKEQNAIFSCKNVGDKPLVIEDVNTSCGCTLVEFEKEPVRSGEVLDFHVKYKADHPEYFNKTITIYCNAETSPIKLTITGDAK